MEKETLKEVRTLMRWQCVHCEEPLEKDHSFCLGCGRMLEEWERTLVEQAMDEPVPAPGPRRTLGRSFFFVLGTLCGALFLLVFLVTWEGTADGVRALVYGTLLLLFFMTFGFVVKYLLELPKHPSSVNSTRSAGSVLRSRGRRMSGGKR